MKSILNFMRNLTILFAIALSYFVGIAGGEAQSAVAQTTLINCQTQIVTLAAQNNDGSPVTYNVNSNQVVTVSGVSFSGTPTIQLENCS